MSTSLWIALAAVVVVLLVWMFTRRSGGGSTKADRDDRIDTLIGWPPQATRVLSNTERAAYGTLVRALPDYIILSQVPLSRFLSVPKRNSYADWLRRVGYQCVDFVVCDMAAQVVAVIELQGTQMSERARKRQTRMSRSLQAADIRMLVWNETGLPSSDAVREAILPKPVQVEVSTPARQPLREVAQRTPALATVGAAPAVAAAPAARLPTPFDDSARDSTHDERIELLEPPPSTWFDDLDSDPVPLMPLSKR